MRTLEFGTNFCSARAPGVRSPFFSLGLVQWTGARPGSLRYLFGLLALSLCPAALAGQDATADSEVIKTTRKDAVLRQDTKLWSPDQDAQKGHTSNLQIV